jgi:hypothetical protein
MRSPTAVGPHSVAFELGHARTILSHPRSRSTPFGSFQGEDTYMPAGNFSGDIHRVVGCVHVPELHRKLR